MSNLSGPMKSPTENLTFELDRLLRISPGEEDASSNNTANNNNASTMDSINNVIESSSASAQNNNSTTMLHQVAIATAEQLPPVPNPAATFSSISGAAHAENWAVVREICESFAADTAAARQSQPHREAKHQLIALVQNEFETAFTVKNIKRRQSALMIVAHLFSAKKTLISEKVVVGAIYRALGVGGPSSAATASPAAAAVPEAPPPLHALLAVARALSVASSNFQNVGIQHLPAIVSKLCAGMLTSTPSAEQHAELCDAIRHNSAVLHGFRA